MLDEGIYITSVSVPACSRTSIVATSSSNGLLSVWSASLSQTVASPALAYCVDTTSYEGDALLARSAWTALQRAKVAACHALRASSRTLSTTGTRSARIARQVNSEALLSPRRVLTIARSARAVTSAPVMAGPVAHRAARVNRARRAKVAAAQAPARVSTAKMVRTKARAMKAITPIGARSVPLGNSALQPTRPAPVPHTARNANTVLGRMPAGHHARSALHVTVAGSA